MRSGNFPEAAWNKCDFPVPSLWAYNVSEDANGKRKFTADSTKDITDEYIELNSIHFEQTHIQGDDFKPGGVIPSRLSVKVLKGCPGLSYVTATPYPATPLDVTTMYQLRVRYYTESSSYPMGGRMFCVSKSNDSNGETVTLIFEDELRILDYSDYDLSRKLPMDVKTVVEQIFGDYWPSSAVSGSDNLPRSMVDYSGDDITRRQALSMLTEICGCSIITRDDNFIIRPLVNDTSSKVLNYLYTRDYSFDDYRGRWSSAFCEPNDRSLYYTGNLPEMLYIKNPLITNGNYTVYNTLCRTNACLIYRNGFEIEARVSTILEPGDRLKVQYKSKANIITNEIPIISRIEWNGGAFYKLTEARFDPVNRIG